MNLYILTRNTQEELCTQFENVLSDREEVQRVRPHEFSGIIDLVQELLKEKTAIENMDGFYYSYVIKHIGKEFDLLKICTQNKILNIELKSTVMEESRIRDQLEKNRYYLKHIAPEIYSYTYVQENHALYTLKNGALYQCKMKELASIMEEMEGYETGNIDKLFRAKDFLISPLNHPEKFLENKYFLTQHQDAVKREILQQVKKGRPGNLWGIQGTAGTGKTLLLYDVARTCGDYGRCCIIHCGLLCEGHTILDSLMENVDIVSVKEITSQSLKRYDYLFIDETQRIYTSSLDMVLECWKENHISCVFSYDYFQTLSRMEERRNVPERLRGMEGFQERTLSDKIRNNPEIVSFIKNLLDLRDISRVRYSYSNIDVLYAAEVEEAQKIIKYYRKEKQYTFIGYTQSKFYANSIDCYQADMNTHQVIGQEFDNVIIMMDGNFMYSGEGKLLGREHPNPDYIFYKLFFQGISRPRERLCIVVVENVDLFKHILSIKYRNIVGSEES